MEMLDTLIGREQIASYFQIAKDIGDDFIRPSILHAQNIDVKPVIGNRFFTDLVANKNDDKYQKLLNGGTYQVGGETFSFSGLAAAIACFSYARYITGKNVNDTNFGVTTKKTDVSEPADPKSIAMKANEARASGGQFMSEVLDFLIHNQSTYTKWIGGEGRTSIKQNAKISYSDRF